MKSLIDCINEAYKVKMSKLFSTIDKLGSALMWHPGSRSSLPKTLTKEEFKALSDNIYNEYHVFVNSYIFSDDGELYLAWFKKIKNENANVDDSPNKFKLLVFIEAGHQINKLQFVDYEKLSKDFSKEDNLLNNFKKGISLDELVKKYKYDPDSKLNSAAKKFVKELEEK